LRNFKFFRREFPEGFVRVVAAPLPCVTVEQLVEHARGRMPAPPKIFTQFPQAVNAFGELFEILFRGINEVRLTHLIDLLSGTQIAVPPPCLDRLLTRELLYKS